MATKVSTSENKILFAVLNWGIGHATRSSVLIDELLEREEKVSVYSNGRALRYLQKRYKNRCDFIEGYNYTKKYVGDDFWSYFSIAWKLLKSYKVDSKIVSRLLKSGKYKLFINDCRPLNVHLNGAKSVLINHQLHPVWPYAKRVVQKRFLNWQNTYNAVWVPDYKSSLLSGALSEISGLKNKVFIGPLSRWNNANAPIIEASKSIVFFGIAKNQLAIDVVTGLVELGFELHFYHSEDVDESELCNALLNAQLVVSKPGYSSVMELYSLAVNTAIVDVPWHAEQHQIFKHLKQNRIVHTLKSLSLQELAVLSTEKIEQTGSRGNENLLSLALDNLLNER